MEKISWLDKVTNKEVLESVNENRQVLNNIWQRKHRWFGRALRDDERFVVETSDHKMESQKEA